MRSWYSISLFSLGLLLAGAGSAVAQGTCSDGLFGGDACSVDEDCNACVEFPIPIPCTTLGTCPGTGPGTCSANGESCDTTDFGTVIACTSAGGTCVANSPGVCATVSTCVLTSLPVEMTSFDAVAEGSSVLLHWSTASEINNSGFAVERTESVWTGLESWTEVGFVLGSGTTSEPQAYQFRIDDLAVGVHRFRLKQVDFDGAFDYSGHVEATVEVPGDFVLEAAYPNPFNPTTTIRFAVSTQQQVSAILVDASGRVVRELYNGSPAANDMQSLQIDGSGLASGTYQVVLRGERFSASEQVTLVK